MSAVRAMTMAEVRSHQAEHRADLVIRAASTVRERGLPADAEFALWLERAALGILAGCGVEPEVARYALEIAQALLGEGRDQEPAPGNRAIESLAS